MNLAGPPPAWPIYKYQPITTLTLSNLSKRKLWASPPSSFNDPFECRLQRTDSPKGLEQLRLGNPQLSHLNDEEFVTLTIAHFEQQFARWGIVCFSQRADDIMMWSHYANHHRGMCLAFSHTEKTPMEEAVYPVEYIDHYPALRVDQIWHGEGLARVLHAKYSGWRYECELRRITVDRVGLQEYPGHLSSVVFGLRTSDADQDLVRKIVGTDDTVEFLKASLDPMEYKMNIVPA